MEKRISLYLFLLNFLLISQVSWADCYLTLESQNLVDEKAARIFATVELSNFVEPILETPPQGLSEQDCQYVLSLTGLFDRMLLVLKGPRVSAYSESQLEGITGFQQALVRLISVEFSGQKEILCQKYAHLLGNECGARSSKKTARNPPSTSANTVLDSDTLLVWQKGEGGKMSWKNGKAYCSQLILDDFSDWRLPDRSEMASSQNVQALFPNLEHDYYWTATLDPDDKNYAWGYTVDDRELFDDGWIKNLYNIRCVRGQGSPIIVAKPSLKTEIPKQTELSYQKNLFGWFFNLAPTYLSGLNYINDAYYNNFREQGYTVGEQSYFPIGTALTVDYLQKSGLRFEVGLGPLVYIVVDGTYNNATFTALPLFGTLGYMTADGFYFAGGLSSPNASGDFVVSEKMGLLGIIGLKIKRLNFISFGFEAGIDSSTVEITSYHCPSDYSSTSFSGCSRSTKDILLGGFLARFLITY